MRLSTLLQSTAESMQQDFERLTAELASPGTKGAAREEIVRQFLRCYLPRRFDVDEGQATDRFGNTSGQMDALILDLEDTPILYSAPGAKVFLCESVRGAIEVKSRLTKNGLLEDARKIRRLKRLRRALNKPFNSIVKEGEEPGGTCPPIIGGLFAYSSAQSMTSLCGELVEWNSRVDPQEGVDFLAILNMGILTFGGDGLSLFEAKVHEGTSCLQWPVRPAVVLLLVCFYVLGRLHDFQCHFGKLPVADLLSYFGVASADILGR
jgi:hypothetical protein